MHCSNTPNGVKKFLLISAMLPGSVYCLALAAFYLTFPLRYPAAGPHSLFHLALVVFGLIGLFAMWIMALRFRPGIKPYDRLLPLLIVSWLCGLYVLIKMTIYWGYKASIGIMIGDPQLASQGAAMALILLLLARVTIKFYLKSTCSCACQA